MIIKKLLSGNIRLHYQKLTMASPGKFLYFAYGSNLSTERIHLNNPSAVAKGPALLKDFKLNFNYGSNRWHGCAATIEMDPGSEVYGILWELDNAHLSTLDDQEGVSKKVYRRFEVEVQSCDKNGKLSENFSKAYTYQLLKERYLPEGSDCRPSTVYKRVIVHGAIENGLPEHYIRKLEKIEDNGYDGEVDVQLPLHLQ